MCVSNENLVFPFPNAFYGMPKNNADMDTLQFGCGVLVVPLFFPAKWNKI